jgi:hypothetical protein
VPTVEVRAAVDRSRRKSEHPLSSRAAAALAAEVVRLYQGLLADLP